ncbi:hypothetical protein FSP39_010114 [Pinctada imbricata]|uniref:Uncharacterized protein n=1 Tax=Pinctada imbricata TaxID=66713 RepID=A0AA89C4T8_PINIB|nr:hypothetical protein FSP39_010114 [Pinctada imbricata]
MFMTSFILNVEQPIEGDDTAANYVNFRCRKFDGSKQRIIKCNHVTTYGYYGQWSSSCPSDFAICGMETKSEPNQGSGDDSALNDVTFFCCDR